MRIAFVSYDFPEYCIRHVSAMTKDAEVLLMLPRSLAADHADKLHPDVHFEPFDKPRYRQPLLQARTLARIVSGLRRFRPDVLHFQNGHPYFNLVLPLLRRYPLVITVHDPRQHRGDQEARLTPQFVMDFGFRQADRVIVHGTAVKRDAVRELGFSEHLVHVIPHIAIGDPPATCTVREDTPRILFFGRIWEYKGLEFLIRAEPIVTKEFPDARFVIAGKGEDLDKYRRIMTNPERFEVYDGWISEEDKASLFAHASIVALPYIEASQSGVIPVAYSFEKPVIATQVGGLPDMVDHGGTGLLVPPADVEALAAAILRLLRSQEERQAMGIAGHAKLTRECAPEVVAGQTLAVYDAAVTGRHIRTSSIGTLKTAGARPEPDREDLAAERIP